MFPTDSNYCTSASYHDQPALAGDYRAVFVLRLWQQAQQRCLLIGWDP